MKTFKKVITIILAIDGLILLILRCINNYTLNEFFGLIWVVCFFLGVALVEEFQAIYSIPFIMAYDGFKEKSFIWAIFNLIAALVIIALFIVLGYFFFFFLMKLYNINIPLLL